MQICLKEVLKRELKARNESIHTVARACKIPSTTLHEWMQGRIKVLGDYLGISITTLLFNVKDTGVEGAILFSSTFVDEDRKYRLIIEKLPK